MFRVLAVAMASLFSVAASAVPSLQLDIEGGHYHQPTEDIVSDPLGGEQFTVYALGDLDALNKTTSDTFYLAAALSYHPDHADNPAKPTFPVDPATLGSFSIDGVSIAFTDPEMNFGKPPVDEDGAFHDGGDLGSHGVYDTYFFELAFTFDDLLTTSVYNTEDSPGGTIGGLDDSGSDLYYMPFLVDKSNMHEDYELHFDLYAVSTSCHHVHGCDTDILAKAPFSHDASSWPTTSVPEPASIALFGLGLAGLLVARRRLV